MESERAWPPSHQIAEVLGEPWRVGSEQRWAVRLTDGGRGVLAQLLPELRRDEAVRQRYVGDLARAGAAAVPGVARLLDRSPEDDPAPWRLREDPQGESLHQWLEARAPAPIDAVAHLGAALADILHALHQRGVVVRDLHPRVVVVTEQGPVLTDIGLARVDLLSTRTAASLVLEGTPYASPEQLRKTFVDQRSDLYGLGVVLWSALTGTRPYGDDIALLADPDALPSLRRLRPDIPEAMARCVEQCVQHDAERRPESAAFVAAVLRGERSLSPEVPRVVCQSCGASLLQGQRLCLACGKEAVVFTHEEGGEYSVVLRKISERVETREAFREKLEPLSVALPELNFIEGDARMYSKAERKRSISLPARLFSGMSEQAAQAMARRLETEGAKVAVRKPRSYLAVVLILMGLPPALVIGLTVGGVVSAWVAAMTLMLFGMLAAFVTRRMRKRKEQQQPLLTLRSGPAALPASDPLVARLSALVQGEVADDIRDRLGQVALTLQQLIDHRAKLPEVERREVEVVTEPIEALVGLLEAEVRRVGELDAAMAELDEGALVRALASAEASGADPEPLLDGLHRLRDLEQSRAAAMHRLLEASTLLRRAAEMGLRVKDGEAQHERDVQSALAALGGT